MFHRGPSGAEENADRNNALMVDSPIEDDPNAMSPSKQRKARKASTKASSHRSSSRKKRMGKLKTKTAKTKDYKAPERIKSEHEIIQAYWAKLPPTPDEEEWMSGRI